MSDAAEGRHGAADEPADPGMSPTRETAVVGQRFREPHADPGADRCGEPDEEGIPAPLRRDGRGEHRGERGYGAVHQTRESRLHDLQHEETPAGFFLLALHVGLELLRLQRLGPLLV